MNHKQCPCGSGNSYDTCCKPFHEGIVPDTALQLMRSRYTAYALTIPSYIIQTTHPANSEYRSDFSSWEKDLRAFSFHTRFERLEIIDFVENGSEATVTFIAYLSQQGQNATFREKSLFEKVEGKWLYRSGEVHEIEEK